MTTRTNSQAPVRQIPLLGGTESEDILRWVSAVTLALEELSAQVAPLVYVPAKDRVISGSGTPEAALYAPIGTAYFNTAGTSGTLEYRKVLADIGGDTTKGWVAV